jgi:uncharacterized protein
MMETIYFDTSALAKWYLNEENSDKVENYLQEQGVVAISELTVVEMRSLLARRRRETVNLISVLSDMPLRTLDALHLVIAKEIGADVIATADRVMADGAAAMKFSVINFAPRRG